MKKLSYTSFLLFCLYACNNADKGSSENDIDAARNFIQSSLKGDLQLARTYMIQDSANLGRMAVVERVNLSPDERKGLAGSSINIHNVSRPNDSTTIVIYSNSFRNNWDTLRVEKFRGRWLVDFDYLWDHDQDSLSVPAPLLKTDSLSK